MRICLLSATYPPYDTEGISRQRRTLATELARHGHHVHVVTLGARSRFWEESNVHVHQVKVNRSNSFSDRFPGLNELLSQGLALYGGLCRSLDKTKYDIVDVPLWDVQGLVTQLYYSNPIVLWLQTTTMQILRIHGREPSEDEKARLALEKLCLEQAYGILADSKSILDAVRQDYKIKSNIPTGVAYLGLPPLASLPNRQPRRQVEVLVVGRLEKRKGTPFLFEVLPPILRRYPELTVRFIGRDNSVSDGWHALHKATYPQYFREHYPDLADRVIFEGYVSEHRLQECYNQADFFLAPSLYESFGLTFLEAMRSGLPVISFSTGAATEIFARGKDDGALLVPVEDSHGFTSAISLLIENPGLRCEIGQAGFERFLASFTAEAMARSTLRFYEKVLARHAKTYPNNPKIYQVMEALDAGDAVSKIAIKNSALLEELGQPREILTFHANESVGNYTISRRVILSDPNCGLIFHYWGYNHSTWMLPLAKGRKAIYYHNITPPEYFPPDSAAFRLTSQGYTQLARILDHFDLLIGDSQYNLHCLSPYLSCPKPAIHIYPVVDSEEIKAYPYDELLLNQLRSSGRVNIIFVGRVARNKRHDLLMQVFDYFYRRINRHAHLWLVGNDTFDPAYRAELEQMRLSMASWNNIHFTGKVSDTEVYAYYRAADLFLSASEHEGFGMPLVEAMAFDIPVIAYAAAATPETMGKSGILIKEWDIPHLAELMHLLMQDANLRTAILQGQRQNLLRFTAQEARLRLNAVFRYLQNRETSPLFYILTPTDNGLIQQPARPDEQASCV